MISGLGISRQYRNRGFTLMEMMIAMALVGVALTIGFSALRFASRSWEHTDKLASELDQLRIATSVIRRQLNQALAIRPDETTTKLLFSGSPNALEFIAPAPVQDGRLTALYRYRLRFSNETDGKALRLDYRPWLPGDDPGWQRESRTSLLVSGLQDGEFAYFSEAPLQGGRRWKGVWDKPERLPLSVRVTLQLQDHSEAWPELVILLPVSGGVR